MAKKKAKETPPDENTDEVARARQADIEARVEARESATTQEGVEKPGPVDVNEPPGG